MHPVWLRNISFIYLRSVVLNFLALWTGRGGNSSGGRGWLHSCTHHLCKWSFTHLPATYADWFPMGYGSGLVYRLGEPLFKIKGFSNFWLVWFLNVMPTVFNWNGTVSEILHLWLLYFCILIEIDLSSLSTYPSAVTFGKKTEKKKKKS